MFTIVAFMCVCSPTMILGENYCQLDYSCVHSSGQKYD